MVSRIFSEEEVEEIRKYTLWDIIVNSTEINPGDLQKDVFRWREGDPCPQPVQLNTSLLEPCKYLKGFDYFEVNLLKISIKTITNKNCFREMN